MLYKELKNIKEETFRRLTGVKLTTFNEITVILKTAEKEKKRMGGSPNKLLIEDRLLMTLEYWREYRTFFHIAKSRGISESCCYRNIKWIENILIKHPNFSLPGKKVLKKNDIEYEVVMIDTTETSIERPKKNKKNSILVRKKDVL